MPPEVLSDDNTAASTVEEDAPGSEDVAAYQAWVASRVRSHLGVAGEPLARQHRHAQAQ